MQLLVDKDWGSSSLWVPSNAGWASCDHHSFNFPNYLQERCDYLSDWYESYWPGTDQPEPDWESYSAYKLALAIDIKRHYGEAAQIFVWQGDFIVEISGEFSQMTRSAS